MAKITTQSTRQIIAVAFGLLLLLMALNAQAQTNVSGTISSDTTWDLAGSSYMLDGDVIVNNGVTLTLQLGVVVKGRIGGPNGLLNVLGTLIADGTPAQPIVFTSASAVRKVRSITN
jgi:hypothetical protein